MGSALFGNDKAKSRGQQRPCHVGEGKEKESTATPGIDRPNRGPSKDEVDETESKRGEEGSQVVGTSVDENGRGIESNDIDTAHLLSQHDGEGSTRCTSDAGNGEKFDEAGNVVALANDICLLLNLRVDVVQITSGLKRSVAETAERSESVGVAALFDVPPRRLGAEVNTDEQRKCGNHGGSQL